MTSVGKSIPHDSAAGHVTGTAVYIDDMRPLADELFVDFIGSPVASGRLEAIDVKPALAMDGVVAILTHRDLPTHKRLFGPIFHDEPFLVEEEMAYIGQPIAIVAATSRSAAHAAVKAIVLKYETLAPILSIDDAIRKSSYLGPRRKIERGDVDTAIASAPHHVRGVLETNGQEQFYFESQACIAIPGEAGEMRVISSTQNPTETQSVVAEALGVGFHQVVCECKRMGGGFGGKETQSALPAIMAALVAAKTNRSARVIYGKDQDMICTGKRHAYQTTYQAAFDDDGRILAVDVELHSNGGAYADLSTSVMERSMLHMDNAYYLPNARIVGQVCKMNYPPNTAFRGFGGPQGVAIIETILQAIAQHLGKDAWDIRRLNAYRDGDSGRNITPYGQLVRDHVIVETLDQLRKTSDYDARVNAIDAFNASSRLKLKGIAMSPIKFGISFTSKFLNQGNALVNVYTDGTIQVSTGGTEMGQGLNTKIRQIVADQFGIDPGKVALMTTSTEKNNNTSPTAASAGTDLNGQAAVVACEQIRLAMSQFAATKLASMEKGLAPSPEHICFRDGFVFDNRNPVQRIEFGTFCDQARRERVDLGARGFYATPGVDFNRETGQGTPFFYYTTGAAVAEVTIDRFTGEMTVDRVDLLMDVGKMINPGIDIGQIIGGFVQGMGWCTNEELVYDASGRLLSTSPTTYKIPNITDIPTHFHVATIDNPKHEINVSRSKAVGEPPLMLGLCVWLAAKDAIWRLSKTSPVLMSLPATAQENLACMSHQLGSPLAQSAAS
jgi:xanthine dehydrogenase large subunit